MDYDLKAEIEKLELRIKSLEEQARHDYDLKVIERIILDCQGCEWGFDGEFGWMNAKGLAKKIVQAIEEAKQCQ